MKDPATLWFNAGIISDESGDYIDWEMTPQSLEYVRQKRAQISRLLRANNTELSKIDQKLAGFRLFYNGRVTKHRLNQKNTLRNRQYTLIQRAERIHKFRRVLLATYEMETCFLDREIS